MSPRPSRMPAPWWPTQPTASRYCLPCPAHLHFLVRVSVRLLVCLLGLTACLSVSLSACLLALTLCLDICLFICLPVCLFDSLAVFPDLHLTFGRSDLILNMVWYAMWVSS